MKKSDLLLIGIWVFTAATLTHGNYGFVFTGLIAIGFIMLRMNLKE